MVAMEGAIGLLALATMWARRYHGYRENFPRVHRGVDSAVFEQIQRPFDFIVVGSGYAGSFIARQIAHEYPCQRVLMLEAGDIPDFDTAIPFADIYDINRTDWHYFSVPQKNGANAMRNNQVRLAVAKALGGDSVLDNAIYTPPNLNDFHRWSYLYNLNGWGYVEMKPYMFEINDNKAAHHDTLRNMSVNQVLDSLHNAQRGIDIMDPLKAAWLKSAQALNVSIAENDDNMFYEGGVFLPKTMISDGRKMNAAAQFLMVDGKSMDNLVIITKATVEGLLYTPDGRRVVGVTFRDSANNAVYHVNCHRDVILAAGAIGTASILMQSGIGPRDVLSSQNIPVLLDLPIGQELHDRVKVPMYVRVKPRFMVGLRSQINSHDEFMSFLQDGTGLLANTSILGCAMVRTGYVRTPDLQIEMSPIGLMGRKHMEERANYRREIIDQIDIKGDTLANYGGLMFTVTVLRPFSVGTMWLWRQPNDTFVPRMNPSYLTDTRDVDTLVEGIHKVEELLANQYFGAIGAEILYPSFPDCPAPLLPVSREYLNCYVRHLATTGDHITSTVPLGKAVDERLRVKGVAGVRVVDQSLFPESASGGISSTVLAVANRAYRFIRNDNRLRC